jgi:hypothetical protein
MGKDKQAILSDLQNSDDLYFDSERYRYLVNQCDIYWRRAAALIVSENGYSHSGIASLLDVTSSTAKGYLDDLTDAYGLSVIESHPKSDPNDALWPTGYHDPYAEE